MNKRTLSALNREALLVKLNRLIENSTERCAEALARGSLVDYLRRVMAYPPIHWLTAEESDALNALKTLPHIESALRKVVADVAAGPTFHFLAIVDGVGVPDRDDWSYVSLLDKDPEQDEDDDFLHPGFCDHYWSWRRMKPDKGWKLDTWEGPDLSGSGRQ